MSVEGQWKYLFRVVDRDGATVDSLLVANRNLAATRHSFELAIGLHGLPNKNNIDKSDANTTANQNPQIDTGGPIESRQGSI